VNKEFYFIDTFRTSGRTAIGDDGARIGRWVYSKDLFFENVHFRRRWLDPYRIGYKAMIVNISDAIAMNATPRYALLGVGMPKSITTDQMDELSRGIRDAAERYGIEIIGGDTIANVKLDLSVTIVSEASAKTLLRSGIKEGDCIAYTGTLGESARQLRYLMAGGKVHSQSRFVSPVLRQRFIRIAASKIRSGMDISDGLYSDLGKLSAANAKGFSLNRKIPKPLACSGEEYEMLIAFSPRNARAIQRLAALARTPITVIGRVKRGKFANRCKAHHF
jgi:thiamine-monophosphate kinase